MLRHGDSTERFGFEWNQYSTILPESRAQLQRWLGTHGIEAFAGLRVLDVGCGMGRNPYWIAQAGASAVVAVDLDEGSLARARANLSGLKNAQVERCSAYQLDQEKFGGAGFDRVTCIGVLHHLEDPGLALEKMWRCVSNQPGSSLLLWCYAREGNEAWLPLIQFARAVGSRLPIRITHAFAKMIALPLWSVIHLVPWRVDYFKKLRNLSYVNFVSIIFDQMLPRIAHYWSRDQLTALLSPLSSQGASITMEHVQGNSWFVRATRV